MNIQLHKNARTTPAIRLELQSPPESVNDRELAEAYHLNRHTVAKWRQREGVEDNLSPSPAAPRHAQEAVAAALHMGGGLVVAGEAATVVLDLGTGVEGEDLTQSNPEVVFEVIHPAKSGSEMILEHSPGDELGLAAWHLVQPLGKLSVGVQLVKRHGVFLKAIKVLMA